MSAGLQKTSRRGNRRKFVAWGIWVSSTIISLLGLIMIPYTHHLRHYQQVMSPDWRLLFLPMELASSAVFIIFATVGLLMQLRTPENRMGWWAVAIGIAGGLNTLSGNYTLVAYIVAPERWWPFAPLAAWIEHWMTLGASAIGIVFIPLFFPDGRLPSPRWRPFFLLSVTALLTQFLLLAFGRMDVINYAEGYGIANPYGLWEFSTSTEALLSSMLLLLVAMGGYLAYRQWRIFLLAATFIGLTGIIAVTGFRDLVIPAIMLGVAASLIWRLRNTRGEQHQQIKWMVWSFSLTAVFGAARLVTGGQLTLWGNIFHRLFSLSWIITAGTLAVSLFKYRLYDIDIIIRRTVQYAAISAILVTTYFSSVILLQTVFTNIVEAQSPPIVIISTLVTAALFNPLRTRLQSFIDRRFYRQKYDAQQILQLFAQTARDEVEMKHLTAELLSTIQEIIQPEQLSLWLPDNKRGPS
jgi:hypothetical protein